jgi:tetratricopeptide (TPR) repeat protein
MHDETETSAPEDEDMTTHRNGSRLRTLVLTPVLAVVLALSIGACGGDDPETVGPDPKKAAVALEDGLKAQTAGNLDEAERKYYEALKYDPKNKFAHYDLAVIDSARSNYGLAAEKYRVALGIDPKYGPALFNLAILERGKGNTAEAVGLYKRAVAANPKDAAAHLNLGLLLRETGEKAEGNAAVAKAIKLNPKLKDPAPVKPKGEATSEPAASTEP